MAICKILVPYDFSEYSDRALQTAYKLGRPSEIELHLVHVLDDMDSDSERNTLQRLSRTSRDCSRRDPQLRHEKRD